MVEEHRREAEESFGAALQRLRKARGLSLADLQKRTSFSRSHLGNVENDRKRPTRELADACDQALNAGGMLSALVPVEPPTRTRDRPRPVQMPAPGQYFFGRDLELAALRAFQDEARIAGGMPLVCVDGTGGVGKTSLVVRWAHMVASQYPDGVLFEDLRGYGDEGSPADPADVLQSMLLALGASPQTVPAALDQRSAYLRTLLHARSVLLILDNAWSAAQVRPLLPASSTCMVVVTSRTRLSGLAAREGASRLHLERLSEQSSVGLLTAIIGDRATADPAATRDLAHRCDYLPLALRIVAERVTSSEHADIAALVRTLKQGPRTLSPFSSSGDSITELRTVFAWSYDALAPRDASLFRLLSLHPGTSFTASSVAALATMSEADAASGLERLTTAHLIDEVRLGRYRMHDLLQRFAAERTSVEDSASERSAATHRLLHWYLGTANAALQVISPCRAPVDLGSADTENISASFSDHVEAAQWCEDELVAMARATRIAAKNGDVFVATRLPIVLCDYFYRRKPWRMWLRPLQDSLAAATAAGDDFARGWMHNLLGNAGLDLGNFRDSEQHYLSALRIRAKTGPLRDVAWTRAGLGRVRQAAAAPRAAADQYGQAMSLFIADGDPWGAAIAMAYVGDSCRELGQLSTALEYLRQSARDLQELGDPQGEGCALERLALVFSDMHQWRDAIATLERGLEVNRAIGDRWGQAHMHNTLGNLWARRGNRGLAEQSWQASFEIFDDLGDRMATALRRKLNKGGHDSQQEVA
jgi:tetratricopeptide (TPR) repeat protein/transcriptional regulator with XRE-family HTH domain